MTKVRNDLIFDYETLGQNVFKCPILDCAKFVFSWDRFSDNPYTLHEIVDSCFYTKVSVEDQVSNYGSVIEPDALDFWKKQSTEVRQRIKPTSDDLSLENYVELTTGFLDKSPKISYWWSRANVFDPLILWRIFDTFGKKDEMDRLLKFWKVRDVRTHIDAKFDFTTKNGFVPISDLEYWAKEFKEHDCRFDIAADVLRIQAIYRAENELPQTSR